MRSTKLFFLILLAGALGPVFPQDRINLPPVNLEPDSQSRMTLFSSISMTFSFNDASGISASYEALGFSGGIEGFLLPFFSAEFNAFIWLGNLFYKGVELGVLLHPVRNLVFDLFAGIGLTAGGWSRNFIDTPSFRWNFPVILGFNLRFIETMGMRVEGRIFLLPWSALITSLSFGINYYL